MSEYGRIDAQEIPPEVVQLLASRVQVDPSRVRTIVLESGSPATEDRWISIPDAAARYSLHPAILLKLAKDGVIRANGRCALGQVAHCAASLCIALEGRPRRFGGLQGGGGIGCQSSSDMLQQ